MSDHECKMEGRIRALETGQAETRVYVKEIREDIKDIKDALKPQPLQSMQSTESTKAWSNVTIELIKLIALCVTIMGSVLGAAKMMG